MDLARLFEILCCLRLTCEPYHLSLDVLMRDLAIQKGVRLENFHVVKILIDIIRTLTCQGIAFRRAGNVEVNGIFNRIAMFIVRHCLPPRRWLDNRNDRAHSVIYMYVSNLRG